MPATIILDAYPDVSFPGRVSSISAVAQESSRTSLRRASVLRESLDEAIRYVEEAKEELRVLPPGEARESLAALADFAVERHR